MASKSSKVESLSTNNYFIVMAIISLLVIGATVLIGQSLVKTIVRDAKIISKKVAASDQLTKNIKAGEELVDNYRILDSRTVLISNALPESEDFSGLIAILENMGASAGVTVGAVEPEESTQFDASGQVVEQTAVQADGYTPAPKKLAFSMSVSGSFTGIQTLLRNMEKSSRPVKIQSVQIQGNGARLTAEIIAETAYQGRATIPFKLEKVK